MALISLCAGGMWHTIGKALDKEYNFALDFISIEGL
jgi:hypothetical protein